MNHRILFGSMPIEFNLTYTKRKSLGIKVHPDTHIEVIAPLDAKEEIIFQKIKAKAPWIVRQLEHFNSYRPATIARKFVNGETHVYLGRQYRLRIVPCTTDAIKATRGQLVMYATNESFEALKTQLDQWYRQKAEVVFTELLEGVFPRFLRFKLAKPSLLIRVMPKRWGSCTPGGKIILNPALVKAPKGCIEYVIVHELCHLIHHNHTRAFFDLMSRLMPDWEKWKCRLEHSLI